VLAISWDDLVRLLQEPWFLKGAAAVVLFGGLLLLTRGLRRVAAELERRRALADYVRGLDEFLRGDFGDAIATLERVLERDPENVEARIALGDCYRETGDPAEAKKHHHHVHKVFGNELARNFLSLGRDELALGHYDRAVEAFEKSLDLSRGERDAIWSLASAYAEGGNPIAAAEYLQRLHPDGPVAGVSATERRNAAKLLCDAAAVSLAEGNAESAVRFFTEALAFQPSDLRARSGLLRAAHALGDEERAKQIVHDQIEKLRALAEDGEVLFEAAAMAPAPMSTNPSPEPTGRFLPAVASDMGALVAAVETKTARYRCSSCSTLSREHATVCGHCGSVGTVDALSALNAAYLMPLANHAEAASEIEESAAYVQSLARKAAIGDEAALTRLLAMGTSALYDVFAGLPNMEARRYLGACMARLGPDAAREVLACHEARAAAGRGVRPHDEFAVGFFLALGDDGDQGLARLGGAREAALAGALADPRLAPELRDRALEHLRGSGSGIVPALVDAIATEGDADGARRAAELVRPHGVGAIEKRYLQAKLLGRFLGAHVSRRRAAADILARTGLPEAADVLRRAAAREKDDALRSHYAAAQLRAEKGGAVQ